MLPHWPISAPGWVPLEGLEARCYTSEGPLPGGFLQEVVFEGQEIRAGRGYDSLKCGDFMVPRKVDGE